MHQVGYFWKIPGRIASAMALWPGAEVIFAVVGGEHLIRMGGIGIRARHIAPKFGRRTRDDRERPIP
jgi:hypothetical protein